jgi:hypothetical protein
VGQREPYGHEVPPQAKQLGEQPVTPREVRRVYGHVVQRVYGHVVPQPVMPLEEPPVMQIEKPQVMQIGDEAMESVQDLTEHDHGRHSMQRKRHEIL